MKDQLKSKINIFQIGLILVLAVGLFGTYSVLSILIVIDDLNTGIPFTKTLFFVPVMFLPLLVYSIYYLLTRFPQLTIDKSGITFSTFFKTKSYLWDEVTDIELTGKQPHRFAFITMPAEATTFKFKDKSTFVLWADYYRNISDLRVVLDRADKLLKDKTKSLSSIDLGITQQDYSNAEIDFSAEDKYNGNHFFTFNGLTFYGFLIFVGYMISQKPMVLLTNYGALLSIGFATFVLCGLLSYQMHYFILTDKFLIVKNSIWFWRKDIYPLGNIREVVFETPHRLSTSMRVITKDFKTKLYPAGSLKDKTWKLLEDKFQSKEIEVRNEAFV